MYETTLPRWKEGEKKKNRINSPSKAVGFMVVGPYSSSSHASGRPAPVEVNMVAGSIQ